MAAATPLVVLSRLGEQAAMQLSCILEVFDLVVILSLCRTLRQLKKVSM
jgi:hypothetical protein